jgi:predicted ATPase
MKLKNCKEAMVEKIEIQNYKSIKNQTIELLNLNVLIGLTVRGKAILLASLNSLGKLANSNWKNISISRVE